MKLLSWDLRVANSPLDPPLPGGWKYRHAKFFCKKNKIIRVRLLAV